jgi:two-component system, OmpR family, sensor histidine kinase SenX3
MGVRFRLPMFVVAAALLGLIALLATLQYKWLGRISDAEREGMKATLNARASAFAQDFDSELTRAYLLFQVEPMQAGGNLAERVAARYDRWLATARYPRLIKEVYLTEGGAEESVQRFNQRTRFLEPSEWPDALRELRGHLRADSPPPAPPGSLVVRTIAAPVWEQVPALVVPMPLLFLNTREAPPRGARAAALEESQSAPRRGDRVGGPALSRAPQALVNQHGGGAEFRRGPSLSYTVLLLDRDYVIGEMLPALAQQHFRKSGDAFDYQVAVVSRAGRGAVYQSAAGFSPKPDAPADAAVDLFQVRTQDFGAVAAEVRRFATTFTATIPHNDAPATSTRVLREIRVPPMHAEGRGADTAATPGSRLSIVVQQNASVNERAEGALSSLRSAPPRAPGWRLLVKHPSGSLEGAVTTVRRRNLLISSSILAVLGASVGLLILSTRRAHTLARQQMEFVAAVSHELRTPLAVIRSAGENLADGVIRDDEQIRKYGDLVRNEGRRLTEMVEQILEFAGIQSGQRGFALRPVAIAPMLRDIVESSRALIDAARMQVDYDLPDGLPPVLGEEAALRRVFQNLIGNAVKYGGSGGWIGLRARQAGREVYVTVADRGIGIPPAEHPRIFEPFYRTPAVIAAQTQGAGLGLSLVKRIVDAHGGRVVLRSAPGAGSEFTVVLPAAAAEPVGRPAVSDAQGHGSRA